MRLLCWTLPKLFLRLLSQSWEFFIANWHGPLASDLHTASKLPESVARLYRVRAQITELTQLSEAPLIVGVGSQFLIDLAVVADASLAKRHPPPA